MELVVVVVILGIIAVLAIPQLTRAATSSDDGALLARRLKVLRLAIERYQQDHGAFPGQGGDGVHTPATEATLVAQLTSFTDAQGRASNVRDATFRFGPYLRDGVPPCPVRPHAGSAGVYVLRGAATLTFTPQVAAGWLYHCDTGQITPNTDATDARGRSYASY